MNFKNENAIYVADDGFEFKNKISGATGKMLALADGDSIENYDCVPVPVEEEEIPDSSVLKRLEEVLIDEEG